MLIAQITLVRSYVLVILDSLARVSAAPTSTNALYRVITVPPRQLVRIYQHLLLVNVILVGQEMV